ncbi:MAG: hypothetical protein PHT07_14875 [Paludibacter sp.]|nr:hypothetical protein [Paludibacter sp.]
MKDYLLFYMTGNDSEHYSLVRANSFVEAVKKLIKDHPSAFCVINETIE